MAEATCSVEGCEALAKVRGDCRKHYQAQWYRARRSLEPVDLTVALGQIMPISDIARGRPGVPSFSDAEAMLLRTCYEANRSVKLKDLAAGYGVTQATMHRTLRRIGTDMRHPIRLYEGERHIGWRGGRSYDASGYIDIRLSRLSPYATMRNAGGSTKEHRLVMAKHLGRPLLRSETVHHMNGKRDDNRIENLQLRIGNHGQGSAYRCAECGSSKLEPVEITKGSAVG